MEKTPFFCRAWFWPFPEKQDDPIEKVIERRWWAKVVLASIDALIFVGIVKLIQWLV